MSWVLKGPSSTAYDRREWFAGPDIVEIALAGEVAAVRYTEGLRLGCVVPRAMMRSTPDAAAEAVSELIFGEEFDLFDTRGQWALGRRVADHYIGWVALAALGEAVQGTHRVTAARAPVFGAASIKAVVTATIPHGGVLAGTEAGEFVTLAGGGFVHRRHVEGPTRDQFGVAELFAGAPYLWGGRTPDGVDCSGLVQAAMAAEGVQLKRDTDQQRGQGEAVDFADRRRGDLVFFPGHVGMLVDADTLLHANAYWMGVVTEPLADVVARLAASGVEQPVLAVRRF